MTTGGEGGMLVTNRRDVWERAWAYRDHGRSYDAVYNRSHPPGFRWIFESFGTNWRMTEMQAAIGRSQLRNSLSMGRTQASQRHRADNMLSPLPRVAAHRTAGPCLSFLLQVLRVRPTGAAESRVESRSALVAVEAEGIPGLSGSCSEVYLEKAFDQTNLAPKSATAGRARTRRDQPYVPGASNFVVGRDQRHLQCCRESPCRGQPVGQERAFRIGS